MFTNTCMFCVVYSSIQKFTIITIMKTAIFITIIFVISILSNYLNYCTALLPMLVTNIDSKLIISISLVIQISVNLIVNQSLMLGCNPDYRVQPRKNYIYCDHEIINGYCLAAALIYISTYVY